MDCKKQIIRNDKGEITTVLSPNRENKSILFEKIMELPGVKSKEEALALWVQTYTPEFKKWFRDSKVVDKNGEPLLVYHGSDWEFNEFESQTDIFVRDNPNHSFGNITNSGYFFSESKTHPFVKNRNQLYPVFLSASNPKVLEGELHHDPAQKANQEGFNSVTGKETYGDKSYKTWSVFENNQIKSVFNQGEFGNTSNMYHSLSERELNFYDMQVNQDTTTLEQKQVAEKLLQNSKNISLEGNNYHIAGEAEPFQRTTSVMKKIMNGFYDFQSEDSMEDPYEVNREWGNLTDKILENVITENPNILQEIQNYVDILNAKGLEIGITPKVIEQLVERFKKIKELNPNSILLSQIPLYNKDLKLAGTTDLIIIHPDGSADIIDLKTSLDPITKPFEKTTNKGYKVINSYGKRFKVDGQLTASKKEKHTAQLTIYKSMLENWGIPVNTLSIMPVHITEVNDLGVIQNTESEGSNGLYTHQADPDILAAFKTKDSEQFEEKLNSAFINDSLLEGLIATLNSQIKLFRKNSNYKEAKKIQLAKEKIELLNTANQLNQLIDELYNIFNSKEGHYSKFLDLVEQVKQGMYEDPYSIISELKIYQEEATMYGNLIKELTKELKSKKDDNIDPESALMKLALINQNLGDIETNYKDVINPLIAEKLTEFVTENNEVVKEANANIAKYVNKNNSLREEFEKEGTSDRRKRQITRAITNNENKIGKFKLGSSEGYKQAVLDQLNRGSYKDISAIEAQIISPIMNSNLIIKSFMRTLKDAYESVRIKLFSLEKEASEVFDEFKKFKGNQDDVSKFNEDIVEKVKDSSGNENYFFVQPVNYNEYSKEANRIKKDVENHNLNNPNKKKNVNKELFNSGVRITRPLEDITVENPVTGEKIVLTKGLQTILKEQEERLTPDEFNRWRNSNAKFVDGKWAFYGYNVTMPNDVRFKNSKYTTLSESKPEAFKYYKYLLATYFKSQDKLPTKLFYKLPQIEKNIKDRRREQGIVDSAKHSAKKATQHMSILEESDYGTGDKTIPLLYTNDIGIENVSQDALSSVLMYAEASERYKINYKLQNFAEATLSNVKENNPINDRNTEYGKALAKLPGYNKYLKKYKGNNVAAALESIIDMHIYGKKRNLETFEAFGKKLNYNKIADALMGIASYTQIGGDPVLAVANSITANTSARLNAFGGKYFTMKTWQNAGAIYTANEAEFMKDMFSSAKKGKLSQMAEVYDALQGEYYDQFGRKMTHSKVKKMFSTSMWFSGMHKGEHRAQIKTLVATLLNTPVLDEAGKETNLYEAYQMIEGKLNIKKGYTKLDGSLISLVDNKVKNTLHALGKEAQGVYNDFDRTLVERTNLGTLMMMYKKFIVPGVTRRFRNLQYNVETEDFTEGYYNTFVSKLREEGLSIFKELYSKDSTLTSLEKENLKKTLGEILTMMVLTSLAVIFSAMRAKLPPEDRAALNYLTYFSLRASSELSFFNMGLGDVRNYGLPVNPGGTVKSFRTPFATYTLIMKSFRTVDDATALLSGEGRYKRDMNYTVPFLGNIADKNDPKVWTDAAKLIGLADKMGNMENAINIMKTFQ